MRAGTLRRGRLSVIPVRGDPHRLHLLPTGSPRCPATAREGGGCTAGRAGYRSQYRFGTIAPASPVRAEGGPRPGVLPSAPIEEDSHQYLGSRPLKWGRCPRLRDEPSAGRPRPQHRCGGPAGRPPTGTVRLVRPNGLRLRGLPPPPALAAPTPKPLDVRAMG